jgi:hypothetical protein
MRKIVQKNHVSIVVRATPPKPKRRTQISNSASFFGDLLKNWPETHD